MEYCTARNRYPYYPSLCCDRPQRKTVRHPCWLSLPLPKEASACVSTPVFALLARFLPERTTLALETWHVDDAAAQITLHVTSTPTSVHCPFCHGQTARVRSQYTRTLADLPWDFLPFVNPHLSIFLPHLHDWLTTHPVRIIAGTFTQHGHQDTPQPVPKIAQSLAMTLPLRPQRRRHAAEV